MGGEKMKTEAELEQEFIKYLETNLHYTYNQEVKDRHSLEQNFKKHFERINYVTLSDAEFERLKDTVIKSDVFDASKLLRSTNTFLREDETPLQFDLINKDEWCKNEFEVINQLRMNTENSLIDMM